jgi:flavin reductase (DIM6/NTAB) family NADH-FMN oxidoreductase RutF
VLFCLAASSSSFETLMAAHRVAVHILRQDQEDVARRFATSGLSGEAKLEGVAWVPGPDGVPLIPETPAIVAGRIGQVVTSGDHAILLIDVDEVHLKASAVPSLTFYRGRFSAPATEVAAPQ